MVTAIAPLKWSPGRVDPIRLNLFFDLLFSLSRSRNFEGLATNLGSQLRFVIDIDGFEFILGDAATALKMVYVSSKTLPRGSLINGAESDTSKKDEVLKMCLLGRGAQEGGKVLCYPLTVSKTPIGVFILYRDFPFDHSERRFAEAVGGFLAQMLDAFAVTSELLRYKDLLNKMEAEQKVLLQKLKTQSGLNIA